MSLAFLLLDVYLFAVNRSDVPMLAAWAVLPVVLIWFTERNKFKSVCELFCWVALCVLSWSSAFVLGLIYLLTTWTR